MANASISSLPGDGNLIPTASDPPGLGRVRGRRLWAFDPPCRTWSMDRSTYSNPHHQSAPTISPQPTHTHIYIYICITFRIFYYINYFWWIIMNGTSITRYGIRITANRWTGWGHIFKYLRHPHPLPLLTIHSLLSEQVLRRKSLTLELNGVYLFFRVRVFRRLGEREKENPHVFFLHIAGGKPFSRKTEEYCDGLWKRKNRSIFYLPIAHCLSGGRNYVHLK